MRYLLGCLALAATLTASSAFASPIQVTFSGTLNSVSSGLQPTFAVDDTFSGSYVFESTTPPRAGSNNQFAVYDALTSFGLSLPRAGFSASSAGAPEIQIDNNPPAPNDDRYGIAVRDSDGLAGSSLANGFSISTFLFRLDDTNDAIFSDTSLPLVLSLNDFTSNAVFIFFGDQLLQGTLTNLTFSPVTAGTVPVPPALFLFSTAFGAFGLSRRRRLRGVAA